MRYLFAIVVTLCVGVASSLVPCSLIALIPGISLLEAFIGYWITAVILLCIVVINTFRKPLYG